MKTTVVVLICLVAYCAGEHSLSCTTPEKWEGRIYRIDTSKQFNEYGKISYDETNTRLRIIEEREIGSNRSYYDTLYLYNIRRMYRFDLKTRKCNVTALTEPFRQFGVPPFAKFVFDFEIGAVGVPFETITARAFEGIFSDGAKIMVTVTLPDCIPISSTIFSTGRGLAVSNFYDIRLGILDPNVFIPPQECNQ